MNRTLKGLQPEKVFYFFEEISNIPRGSGNEKEISEYLVNFAKERGLEYIQEECLNVIIKKPGTVGYENSKPVALQGHMDMVCEKNRDTVHDFLKDPLKLQIDGDFVKASGTTLGADNGIAVAFGLAILDSNDISHPPIEFIATVNEEVSMEGAKKLDFSHIASKTLINMDSEEEGELLVSCAGGGRVRILLNRDFIKPKYDSNYIIMIRGLKGGHSGSDIDKQRGNANKIVGRILFDLKKSFDFNISDINGGSKDNAIPREADVCINLNSGNVKDLENGISKWQGILQNEYSSTDENIKVTLESIKENVDKVYSDEITEKIINLLNLIFYGIHTMSMEMKGLVQSSNNLGVVRTEDNKIVMTCAPRSSVRSLKQEIFNLLEITAKSQNAEIIIDSEYPEWQYAKNSKIRDVFSKVYKDLYGKEVKITAMHAGVECGMYSEKVPDLDMIALGPNMFDVHTPDEKVSISSVKRTYEYIVEVLKELK